MSLQWRGIIEIVNNHSPQIIGCRIRVKEEEEILKSLDLSVISMMSDVFPDIGRKGRHQALPPNKSSAIMAELIFGSIAVDECICGPA
jgi:hypothetical protein